MARAFSNVDALAQQVGADIDLLRESLTEDQMPALNAIATFCAVALRVMRKTNPSKIRSECRTVEIQARMDGTPVESRESS